MALVTINGELYHYGVKGMKWGVRKAYRSYNTARKTKYESRADKSKTNFGKRYNIARAGQYEEKISRSKNIEKQKGLFNKIDAAVGYRSKADTANVRSKTYSKMEGATKSKLGKASYKQASANMKEVSKYYNKVAKDDFVDRYMRKAFVDTDYLNMPYHRLSGRTTTRGKQIVDNMLTLGMYGAVKDLQYINAQKKEKEDKK